MQPCRLQEARLSLVRSRQPSFTIRGAAEIARALHRLATEVRESVYAVFLNAADAAICGDRTSTATRAIPP